MRPKRPVEEEKRARNLRSCVAGGGKKRSQTLYFGAVDVDELLWRLVFDPPVGKHASAMYDAAQRPVGSADLGNGRADGGGVAQIDGAVEGGSPRRGNALQSGADLPVGNDTPVLLFNVPRFEGIRRLGDERFLDLPLALQSRQPCRFGFWCRRAAEEQEGRLASGSESDRHFGGDAAGAAADDHQIAGSQRQ